MPSNNTDGSKHYQYGIKSTLAQVSLLFIIIEYIQISYINWNSEYIYIYTIKVDKYNINIILCVYLSEIIYTTNQSIYF